MANQPRYRRQSNRSTPATKCVAFDFRPRGRRRTGKSAWSSAGGALINWQPFDFGKRAGQVDVAQKGTIAAVSATNLTRLGVAASTASAYFDVVAANQLVDVAQANLSRMQTFANSVRVLVENKLRPGADASQADAQLAIARTQLVQAETQEKIRLASLADFLEMPLQQIQIDPSSMLADPPNTNLEATVINTHPAVQQEAALVARQSAQLHVLNRSYAPVFDLLGSVSGHGTGLDSQGNFLGGGHRASPPRHLIGRERFKSLSPLSTFSQFIRKRRCRRPISEPSRCATSKQ